MSAEPSNRVKDYHLTDCAIQTWICQQAGIPITLSELAHVDTRFVYPGGGDYRGLFKPVDVSTAIAPLMTAVPVWITDARTTLEGAEPAIRPGPHCHAPFDCPFLAYRTRDQTPTEPVRYPVESLPYGGQLAVRLLANCGLDTLALVRLAWCFEGRTPAGPA